ncbi:hypothetical protein [Leifsonia sp. C5G2]|uniref:hypothetical protein n=1 Tax=Leifsonia sp. C5G2 TaxID=2735269 RepID=UPI001584518A|nr:hypothetical protein [Leifsonia sp. C5G2]NUU06362.1 hypothetical protein [Leifsonia sp. C5G2]
MSGIPIDDATLRSWVETAHSSRMMTDVLAHVGDPTDGSSFDQVNAFYPPELASDWCRGYLRAALEHLTFWADHVAPMKFAEDAKVIHSLRPVQTLCRAATESASQAVWLMDGQSARECALRHLSLMLHDLDEQRKAASAPEDKARVTSVRTALFERLGGYVTEADVPRFPGYMETVKYAAKVASQKGGKTIDLDDPVEIERLWRGSAGSAHGKRWPSLELQMVVRGEEYRPGQFRTVQIPNADVMTRIQKLADGVTSYGVLRFADFSGFESQLSEILADAATRLLDMIPKRATGGVSADSAASDGSV